MSCPTVIPQAGLLVIKAVGTLIPRKVRTNSIGFIRGLDLDIEDVGRRKASQLLDPFPILIEPLLEIVLAVLVVVGLQFDRRI